MVKELFLLIGTGFGALVTLIATVITSRNQYRIEALKWKEQAKREHEARLREKFEDAHQLLSKIATENSMTASYITLETGVTAPEYHARYQKSEEDVRRLQMIVDLYIPQLHRTIQGLAGLTNQFWGNPQDLLYQKSQGREEAALN